MYKLHWLTCFLIAKNNKIFYLGLIINIFVAALLKCVLKLTEIQFN